MTTITWEQLTADEQEALQSVQHDWRWYEMDTSHVKEHKAFCSLDVYQLVEYTMNGTWTSYTASITDAGREVLAQKPTATEKTVKLRVLAADGMHYEYMFTDGTWADDASEVSHE